MLSAARGPLPCSSTGGSTWPTSSHHPPGGRQCSSGRIRTLLVRAEGNGPQPGTPEARRRRRRQQPQQRELSLEDLNPISLGRETRKVFDDVWQQLQRIGNPAASRQILDDAYRLAPAGDFESPQAANTTVLVVGAAGRVGKVLVRKLLLRGYKVKALVRHRSGEVLEDIPQSVEQVAGDLGDYQSCRRAVEGVDKVIDCAGARTTITADLNRVEIEGVANLTRAFVDHKNAVARKAGGIAPTAKREVVDFANEYYHPFWVVELVGLPAGQPQGARGLGRWQKQVVRAKDTATCHIDEDHQLVFEGAVYTRNGVAEMGAKMERPFGDSLVGCEALVLRLRGDGHPYTLLLATKDGRTYSNRFQTRDGFSTARLPFYTFNPTDAESAAVPLDPADIDHIGIRFEVERRTVEQFSQQSLFDQSNNRFKLKVDWIKAIPGGEETDFILVSCAGMPRAGLSDAEREKIVSFKRRGEVHLRNSGLGYTVVRPGPLVEEAGGYKAMIFDQGSRITEKISCADVADVCLKALHDQAARNISFEVCEEYQPEEGLQSYELIAHLPDRMNGYLTPALASLQRNT